jgi:hypothetical protein
MTEEDRDKEADKIVEKLKRVGDPWWRPAGLDRGVLEVNVVLTPVKPIDYIYVNISIDGKEITIADDQGRGSGPDCREAEED